MKNDILKLQDANGKNIETTIEDINKMVAIGDLEEGIDINIADTQRPIVDNFKVEIVDSAGAPVDVVKFLDAVKEGTKKMPIALDVLIEVTHSGDNANSVSYRSDSMEKDAATFLAPFRKPLLKNHDVESEPMGRVKDSYFGPSELQTETPSMYYSVLQIPMQWQNSLTEDIPLFQLAEVQITLPVIYAVKRF
jgi:hypothetical protein